MELPNLGLNMLILTGLTVLVPLAQSAMADQSRIETGEPQPRLFAPERNWPAGTDASPAFSPDQRTVLFSHAAGDQRTIMTAQRLWRSWSWPVVAPFSGKWRDIEPAMSPDGSYLIFVSNRPAAPGGKPLDGMWNGKVRLIAGGNLWRVDRRGSGWSRPARLPDIVNASGGIYAPAITSDGSIYFNQDDPQTHKTRLYRAKAVPGGFRRPVPVAISDGSISDYDVAVAPDESLMIFSSGDRSPKGRSLLFLASACRGGWSPPRRIWPDVDGNEVRLGPRARDLYFTGDLPQAPGAPPGSASRIFQSSLPIRPVCPPS